MVARGHIDGGNDVRGRHPARGDRPRGSQRHCRKLDLWNAALGSMLTVFFFARLWRRAGIVTDVEFAELRYSGRPAAFLRGFRAVYLGLVINCLIIGWVNLALSKILLVTLGWDRLTAVFVGLAATGLYAAAAGLRGVVVTDFLLFALASAGSVALALFAVSLPEIGGLEGLVGQLPPETFRLLPALGSDDGGRVGSRCPLPLSWRTSGCSGGLAGTRDKSLAVAGTSPSA